MQVQTEKKDEGQKRKSITGVEPGQYRKGKTKRDRENHAHSTNAANKDARATWNNEQTGVRSNAGGSARGAFPYGTCNGKRNRALKDRAGRKA